jgi:Uma2 family endonuclease
MTAARKQPKKMSTDEFLAWSETQPGRWELIDGVPVEMQAERNRHSRVKGRIFRAMGDAIVRAGVSCEAWPDGVSVRVDDERCREPDAAVSCGQSSDDAALEITNAIIVVEVLSPTNPETDRTSKLADYARVASLRHYLIVDPVDRHVIHHRLDGTDVILTRIVRTGDLLLEPPGLSIPVADLLPA